MYSVTANADYPLGCGDPKYHEYIEQRFEYFQQRNVRLLSDTLRDYKLSLAAGSNPYQVIANLSRHLKYSAQFESLELVAAKIERLFEHADKLSVEQQIAGDVFDRFSSETHAVGIARAWIAYRQADYELAFAELIQSIQVSDSSVLRSFGPDFEFIRHIYRDGHTQPVVEYINKTKQFWTGKRPDELRYVWLKMVQAKCEIQFDSIDALVVLQLGLKH